ncbi:MAG: hypothetical protein JNK84_04180 [Phreatobacter sp.]|uniref:hypothetical protein n=1 Tax=Phreatobacter sp. TaxID=1966341 RepID=UPI001A62D82A|nr:hypothetical protein [Phreatobacter sp.]MBL8568261.1 hypothetical protein [Phreatobacter sp.]
MQWTAALILAGMLGLASAAEAQTPQAIVEGIYAGGLTRSSLDRMRAPANRARHFQPPLVRLLAANDREECIDFALTSDGNNYDEAEIARTIRMEARTEGDRASVDVRFMSLGKPNHYRYEFERAGDRWKIADIASLGEGNWRLSQTACGRAGRPAAAGRVVSSAAAASPAGAYCYRNRHALLRLDVGANGSARFRMETVGGGGHSCHLEGSTTPTAGGWRYERRDGTGHCRLDITRAASGAINVRDLDHVCRRSDCGMRASFEASNLSLQSNPARCAS